MASHPEKMRAVSVKEPGGPENLIVETVDRPAPGAGEVLIKVAAAGVNRADIVQRRGSYPPPPGASDILGLEVSGTIVALGANVTGRAEGDEICTLLPGGGYAEYCVAPAETCMPIPDGVSLIEAGGLPETCATVWSNLFDRARLQAGETLLVHGGTSGIGTTAIMLARQLGVTVYTTAGSDEKCAVCRDLGAERAINYNTEDFVEVVRAAPSGGADVILDMVGGDYIQRNIKCLRPEGRMVNIAYLKGSRAEVDFMSVMLKRLTITGSTLRTREVPFKAALMRALESRVWPLFASKKLRPIIDSTFPLERAADAHRRMEASAHIGKLILTM